MFFDSKDGLGYLREYVDGENVTHAKLGKVGDSPTLHTPKLLADKDEVLLSKLPDNSIDLIVTDPPYGVSTRIGRSQYDGQHKMGAKSQGKVHNHDGLDFLEGIPEEFERVLKPDSHLYVFCNHESYPDMRPYFDSVFNMSQLIVWEKPTYGVGDSQTYSPVHEFIMHFRYGSPELRYGDGSKRPKNVITFKRPKNNNEVVVHSTQKPIELMDFLIEKSSDVGDLVLDPYGGSFAVGRAAQHKFRRAICSDLDPEIVSDGRELAEHQLRNDPVYGVDWTEINNLEVEETKIPAADTQATETTEVASND